MSDLASTDRTAKKNDRIAVPRPAMRTMVSNRAGDDTSTSSLPTLVGRPELTPSPAFETAETRRYSGDRALPVSVFTLDWEGAPLRLSVFDPRDERVALKTSIAGRVVERAGIAEVGQMVENEK